MEREEVRERVQKRESRGGGEGPRESPGGKGDLQGYLAHRKTHPPRTLPYAYALGHGGILRGGRFLTVLW